MNLRPAYILIASFAALSLRAACVPTLTVSPRDADGFITVTAAPLYDRLPRAGRAVGQVCRQTPPIRENITTSFVTVVTDTMPGGGVTVYAYDPRGRIATVSRGPSASDPRERIETSYDPLTGKKALERPRRF